MVFFQREVLGAPSAIEKHTDYIAQRISEPRNFASKRVRAVISPHSPELICRLINHRAFYLDSQTGETSTRIRRGTHDYDLFVVTLANWLKKWAIEVSFEGTPGKQDLAEDDFASALAREAHPLGGPLSAKLRHSLVAGIFDRRAQIYDSPSPNATEDPVFLISEYQGIIHTSSHYASVWKYYFTPAFFQDVAQSSTYRENDSVFQSRNFGIYSVVKAFAVQRLKNLEA